MASAACVCSDVPGTAGRTFGEDEADGWTPDEQTGGSVTARAKPAAGGVECPGSGFKVPAGCGSRRRRDKALRGETEGSQN